MLYLNESFGFMLKTGLRNVTSGASKCLENGDFEQVKKNLLKAVEHKLKT
jgi:hypothetical protein